MLTGPTKLTGMKGFVNLVNICTILARLTVRCPSNGRRASSISALPAPVAQTSANGTACSLLPAAGCAAAQTSPPHRTPIAGLAIPLLTHTCYYSPATADEPVNPRTVVLPSAWETTSESSLPPCRSLPRPRRRPPPWCSRRGLVNVVNDRHASEVDCTCERLTAGSTAAHKEMPPYYAQNNDSST